MPGISLSALSLGNWNLEPWELKSRAAAISPTPPGTWCIWCDIHLGFSVSCQNSIDTPFQDSTSSHHHRISMCLTAMERLISQWRKVLPCFTALRHGAVYQSAITGPVFCLLFCLYNHEGLSAVATYLLVNESNATVSS